MIPFKIGNWLINEEGITWDGEQQIKYEIEKDRLTESGPQDRINVYDWLVHMPTKAWLSREDIYALNTALIYAMEHFKIKFPKDLSFVETFKIQEDQLKNK